MEVITYKKGDINVDQRFCFFFGAANLIVWSIKLQNINRHLPAINKALLLAVPRKSVMHVALAQVTESHNREALQCGSWVNIPWMAQPCCVHVQECWVRPKPAAHTHSTSESAWQYRALLSMRTVSQTMLMVGTVRVAQGFVAAFAHNIYPASCKSHLRLLPNTWVLWLSVRAAWN